MADNHHNNSYDNQDIMDANESIVSTLIHLVDEDDVNRIIKSQKDMLARFEKANEMLVYCNHLASVRFERASRDVKIHVQTLQELKKDLDSVFKRIRNIRSKLSQELPDAFKACSISYVVDEEDEDQPASDATG